MKNSKRVLAICLAALIILLPGCKGRVAGESSESEEETSFSEEESEESESSEEDEASEEGSEDEESSKGEKSSSDSTPKKQPSGSQQSPGTSSSGSSSSTASASSQTSSKTDGSSSSQSDRTGIKTGYKQTYTNEALGLTVKFPKAWTDNYTPVIEKDVEIVPGHKGIQVNFLYKDDKEASMAAITAMPEKAYEMIKDTPYGNYLGKNSQYYFVGSAANGSAYDEGPDQKLFDSLHFAGGALTDMVTISEPKGVSSSSGGESSGSSLSLSEQEKYLNTYVKPVGDNGILSASWKDPADINASNLMRFALSMARAAGEDPEGESGGYIPQEKLEKYVAKYFHSDGSELQRYKGYSSKEKGYKNDMGFGGGSPGYEEIDAVKSGDTLTLVIKMTGPDGGKAASAAELKIHVNSDGSFYYLSNKTTAL